MLLSGSPSWAEPPIDCIHLLSRGVFQSGVFQNANVSTEAGVSRTSVDILDQEFRVQQIWRLVCVTKTQVQRAISKLRLSGRYGVYQDSPLMASQTPEWEQNRNGLMVAEKARPAFAPEAFGSTATITPHDDGFVASMSDGPIGTGQSVVRVSETNYENGQPIVFLEENGRYSLGVNSQSLTGTMASFFLWLPPGRLAQAAAHKMMAELHNHVFNPAQAIANIIRDGI